MIFTATPIPGVCVVDLERREDPRGWFARSWCVDEFASRGLVFQPVQANLSFNETRGTLRGMHYQAAPHAESKLVRCSRGCFWDVALDLRPESPAYKTWFGIELSALNGRGLFIPEGCAHGFQTLEDDTEVSYLMGAKYQPDAARGLRWNDPAFGIQWPLAADAVLSPRDASYPDFVA